MAAAEVVDPNRLSYDRGPSAPSLLESTIGANLAATAARYGHREALVDMVARRRFNYSELLTDVHRLATGLVRAGIGPGDRVGIWAPNRWEWVLVQYATAEIGAILVTINPAYRVREVEYALRQSGVAMVIAVASFKDADYAAMLAEVGPRCPDLADVILLESDRWDALAGAEPDLPALQQTAARLDGSDPVNIQYTSGTTAYPKGVTLSHRNILNNGYLVGELLGYTAQDRICIPVPFYHCFGMVMRIAGRIKDLVVRGGENISPREIEELLHTHPDIVDGHVIGVPDAKYGEELMAVVKLRNDAPELTIERLREYCMGRIARFKIPRYLWIVDEFPMTVTGKVRKVEMRQQALEYLRGQQ